MSKKASDTTGSPASDELMNQLLAALAIIDQSQRDLQKRLKKLQAQFDAIKPCKCCKAKKNLKKRKRKQEKAKTEEILAAVSQTLEAAENREPDDLKLIAGVGPKLEGVLNGLGIRHFSQIAAWKKADITEINDSLKFSGRIERDEWIKQAKALAKGGVEEYRKVFGKEPR